MDAAETPRHASDEPRSFVELVVAEVDLDVPGDVQPFVDEIRRRHGASVAAVLFYGSCLRSGDTAEGVLDFYALVDGYTAAYDSRALAWTNRALPPNVYYVELPHEDRTIRAKYNVLSVADFSRFARGEGLHAIVWGRFSQPFRIVYARDGAAREAAIAGGADSIRTMLGLGRAVVPDMRDARKVWSTALTETYGTELRTESQSTIDALYDRHPHRYDRAVALGSEGTETLNDPGAGWSGKKRAAKALYLFRLLKSAWTFGDWLPYALWKFERHTGTHIELSERQRRRPLIYGWPVIFRVFVKRELR